MYRSQRQMQLIDSVNHGTDSELFVVEGESAANSVSALCDVNFQAVLPLQGKPLNAYKASEDKVLACPLYHQFALALGIQKATAMTRTELASLRFGKIFLLFDPDADGIHIGALMLMYIKRWLPELLIQHKIYMVRAPMFALTYQNSIGETKTDYAYLPQQLEAMKQKLAQAGHNIINIDRFPSLGTVPPQVLENYCINPNTRPANLVDNSHIDAVVAMFG